MRFEIRFSGDSNLKHSKYYFVQSYFDIYRSDGKKLLCLLEHLILQKLMAKCGTKVESTQCMY